MNKPPDGIVCPYCQSDQHKVVAVVDEPGHIRRRHRCKNPNCSELFTSFQHVPVDRVDRERFRSASWNSNA